MGVAMARAGRNDLCPCGSGRKFKKCCEAKTDIVRQRVLMIVVGAFVAGALVAGVLSFTTGGGGGGGRVWDPVHGHYHDSNGVAVP
jgi:hypothetical protein